MEFVIEFNYFRSIIHFYFFPPKGINVRHTEYLQNIPTIHDTFLEFYLFDISSVSNRISR